MLKNINVKKIENNQNNFPRLNSATRKGLNNSLINENHQALLKIKVNEYHCKKR